MKLMRPYFLLLLAFPMASPAQKKEIMELQREMAMLQEQMKNLERSVSERLTAQGVMLQQTLDGVTKANTAIAVMQSGVTDRLRDQEKTVAAPMAGLGARMDQMADEFRFVKESIADLNARFSKLQAQLVDISNAIKVLQSPPPPPPAAAPAAATGPPPGMTAESLYQNAYRDYTGANYDIALQQFGDFLKFYGNTDLAPNAQFYIGMIHLNKGDAQASIDAFDLVLEKYQDNNKTADAMFMKGRALLKLGQRTAAAEEFAALIKKYPNTEQAAKARVERKNLGYSTPATKKRK
jgi:tol-pal system protein YbgF